MAVVDKEKEQRRTKDINNCKKEETATRKITPGLRTQ